VIIGIDFNICIDRRPGAFKGNDLNGIAGPVGKDQNMPPPRAEIARPNITSLIVPKKQAHVRE